MSDREFVDTNVLIYAFDRSAGEKREAALRLLERLWSERAGCVSIQVLQEFYVTAVKKLNMPESDVTRQVERLGRWKVHRPEVEDLLNAIDLHRRRRISFWDAMIVRSAVVLGCSVVYSEDLTDGQKWDSLIVRNPFL